MFLLAQLRSSTNVVRQTLFGHNVGTFRQVLSPSAPRQSSNVTKIGSRVFKEARLLQKDNIPEGFHIIYRAPMKIYFKIAHHITSLSAVIVGGLAVYVAIYGAGELQAPFHFDTSSLAADKSDIKYFAAGFILISVGMRYIVMRYPYRIYRNEKQYIAVMEGQIPFSTRRLRFEKGDVAAARPYGILPWKDSWYNVRRQKILLLVDYFKSPSELHNMLVRDKS